MHNVNLQKREIRIGSRTISIETGKLAKQAHGSVVVRSGDTMVLVAASRAANPRDVDFLPLTVDYREYAYAVGTHPRRLLQARGQAARKGSADQPADRPSDPAALPLRLALRDADHRDGLSADTDNDADVLAITGASAALAISEIPFEKTIAGVRVGLVNGQFVINPTLRRAQGEPARPDRRRHQGRHRDGRSRRQAGDRKPQVVGALEAAHNAIKQIVAGIDELKAAVGKQKLRRQGARDPAGLPRRDREARSTGPLADAMRIKREARELRARSTRCRPT